MMDELLMRMDIRKGSEKGGLWKELFDFMAVKTEKKKGMNMHFIYKRESYKGGTEDTGRQIHDM